jgi:hypothetical protein
MECATIRRLFLFALLPIRLIAQTADLSGIIFDPSALGVPNAKVTATAQATGAMREITSNLEGLYSLPALLPGSYDLTVEATGFRSIRQTGIVLEVDQRARLDFTLSIGSTSEVITVEGSAPILQLLRCIREHRDRQPGCNEPAAERPQLRLADPTGARSSADALEFI